MTEISASRVTVRRGERAILHDIDITAKSGDFVAVVGANGAGKSTLLSLFAGLLAPDAGIVRLDGRSIKDLSLTDIARRRAYLPQNPRCEWPISVERVVALGLTPTLPAFGPLPASFEAQVFDMLTQWDLVEQRNQAATTLSNGELARAMIARALVGNPDILIADEPTAGLDPKHALDTVERLRGLAHGGKLVIASIHDLTLAARFATRIVAVDHGRVAADGAPVEILTEELIRSVFEVEARISGNNGRAYIDYISPCRTVAKSERGNGGPMRLDKIYTRGGDAGQTSLGDGQRVPKYHLRVHGLGGLDEANAAIGVALLHVEDVEVRKVLSGVQNDLFDVGADLCRPERDDKKTPLRITGRQVERLEGEIDHFNGALNPLTSFVLPGGSPASAHLHIARAILRRAERDMTELAAEAPINAEALKYVNRLSDLLFVLARYMNARGTADVLWEPGLTR